MFYLHLRINCLLGNSCNLYYILVISLNITKQRFGEFSHMSIERLGRNYIEKDWLCTNYASLL